MDTNYVYGDIPALTRERYAEAHELIMRAWREPEPFAFNGRYTKLRYANCWPKPVQSPPPIFIPGGGSLETYDFCLDFDYVYCYLSFGGYKRAKQLMDGYWQRVKERGKDLSPYRAGFAQTIVVAESDAEAERDYREHIDYFYNRCLHVYPGFADAPGYRTIKTLKANVTTQMTQQALGDVSSDELGPARARRLRHRRQSRHGGHADEGADHRTSRRQHLLSDPRRQHAERQMHALEQAVRRGSDAAAARHVAGIRDRRPLLDSSARARTPIGCRGSGRRSG